MLAMTLAARPLNDLDAAWEKPMSAKDGWAVPGAKVRCVNDIPDNGIPLPIQRNELYTIALVYENPFISKIGSSVTIALVEVSGLRNEFWLDRFDPVPRNVVRG